MRQYLSQIPDPAVGLHVLFTKVIHNQMDVCRVELLFMFDSAHVATCCVLRLAGRVGEPIRLDVDLAWMLIG